MPTNSRPHDDDHAEEGRRSAIMDSSGTYPDAFPPGYLTALRDDWPA